MTKQDAYEHWLDEEQRRFAAAEYAKAASEPTLADRTVDYISDTYLDMLVLARISVSDKVLTILYDMWRSCTGQHGSPDCTPANHEAYYEALARYFRVDINTIRELSAQAKGLGKRPVERWTLSHKPDEYRPLP